MIHWRLALLVLAGCSRAAPPSAWLPWTEPTAACTLSATHAWSGASRDATYDVRLPDGGQPVARVTGGAARARVWYPLGPRTEVQPIELEDRGVVVHGDIDALATSLYATSAISMDGHLSTTSRTHLQWDGAAPEGLQLSFGSPMHFTSVTPSRVTRACDQVSLDVVEWPPSGTRLTATAPGAMPMALAPDRAIDLHAAAAGPVIGTFEPGPSRPVAAVARAVGWLRIIATDDYDLDGWIEERDAVSAMPPPPGAGCHGGPPPDSSMAPGAPPTASVPLASSSLITPAPSASADASAAPASRDHARCSHEVRFAAGSPPRWIGLFRTGTAFAVLADADADAVYVASVGSSVVAATATSWLLRRADLTGCERSSR